jgi:hypothetical protein
MTWARYSKESAEYFGRVELLQGGGGARRAPDILGGL